MAQVRVAFWNVQNLFEPGVVPRGPQSLPEIAEKQRILAEVIDSFFEDAGPDLLGLAEIGTEAILGELLGRLRDDYVHVWERPGTAEQTGLGLAARRSLMVDMEVVSVQRPSVAARPRCMVVRCLTRLHPEPFLVVVNHWKSRMGSVLDQQRDRLETADWLGEYLANQSRETCVIVIGDFNAEPFEAPFGELRLRGKRTFSNALWASGTPAYLYNTAWRFMSEPDAWEDARQANYVESRPKTTHGQSGVNIFDHLLVSGRALRGGPLELRERSVNLHLHPRTLRQSAAGVLRPRPWTFPAGGDHDGSS
ncbi:MAG: endonuclease/exonuclease/phosphatase family protein, partial [Planctomycetales bacterium]|nr:endonuclease/exonuclease/phosphatase family protein [Planctomycetales bacterium]